MKGKWLGLIAICAAAFSVAGCSTGQRLVSIALQPSGGFVFEGPGAQGQFTAIGTYIHPPENKDVSTQVTWSLDIANFGTLTQTGLITYSRTDGCGSGNVTATFHNPPGSPAGSVISGSAPVSGANNGTATCQ
jgi:hypothetical protein